MPDREIIRIPANRTLADLRRKKRKLRVAAYCRVSTEEEEQQSSFEIQVAYYTNLITNHEGWELTGIFADEGISGVRTNKREQFKEMITLCGKKKIDLILTESFSLNGFKIYVRRIFLFQLTNLFINFSDLCLCFLNRHYSVASLA